MPFQRCGLGGGPDIPLAQVPFEKVQKILESVTEHKRLLIIVRAMAREIERLDEDNAQLRAAVTVYRRALTCRTGPRAV